MARRGTAITSPSLRNLTDAGKGGSDLLTLLRQKQALSSPDDRESGVVHPSELASDTWCSRHDYYRITGVSRGAYKPHGLELENIFQEGNLIHTKWQERFWAAGILEGVFECLRCAEDGTDMGGPLPGQLWAKSPQQCPFCGAGRKLLVYREVPVRSPTLPLAGSADGVAARKLLEVKSIGVGTLRWDDPSLLAEYTHDVPGVGSVVDLDSLWKSIKRPLSSHVRQALIYLHLVHYVYPDVNEATIIYEFKPNQRFKFFTVKYRERNVEGMIDQVEDLADDLEDGVLPDRPSWAEEDHQRCKECAFVAVCYEENEYAQDSEEARHQGGVGASRQGDRGRVRRDRVRDREAGEEAPTRTVRRRRPRGAGADEASGRVGTLGQLLEDHAG